MNSEKPKNIDEYRKWLEKEHDIEISDRTRTYYDSVTSRIQSDFERSCFWVQLTENLREFDSEYRSSTGYPLTLGPGPDICIKPFDSFLFKTFRKNILQNERWPNEPKGGWILPNNWYSRINDVIRTLLVVKYLDGVEFTIDKIQSLCGQLGLAPCDVFLEAKEEGYYAAHLYSEQEFEIPRVTWDTERVKVPIEIQITTQLQEVMRKLLHRYYEERRKRIKEERIKWQWDYQSDEFVANYLGHVLHYVEGMIMEIRERQKGG